MSATNEQVAGEIARGNAWYTGDQFAWAARPGIRPIYDKRDQFFRACIERAGRRFAGPLRFLDAGCGDGYWLQRLGDIPGLEMHGTDYNPLRIERARRNAPRAMVRQADLHDLEEAHAFHVILFSQVIEHIPDDLAILQRTHQLLREGGTLILGTPNEGCLLQRWKRRRRGAAFSTDHVHFYTEDVLGDRLARSDFRVDRVLREIFYTGFDSLQDRLMDQPWGHRLLEALTVAFPSQCSDYYFECIATTPGQVV